MKTYFLIDYENVHEDGLSGLFELDENSDILLFYTRNADKMSLSLMGKILKNGLSANLDFILVNDGKQALDLQLSSYLGFLIAAAAGEEQTYYIVSKDKGFINVASFWNRRMGTPSVRLINAIKARNPVKNEEPAQAETASETEATQPEETPAVETAEPAVEEVAVPEPEKVDAPAEEIKEPVKKSGKSKKKPVKQEKPETQADEPAEVKPEIPVEAPKPEAEETPAPVAEATEEKKSEKITSKMRTQLNSKIKKALSEVCEDKDKVKDIAYQVVGIYGTDNYKQLAYRELVAKYGKKEGILLYNSFKALLTADNYVRTSED